MKRVPEVTHPIPELPVRLGRGRRPQAPRLRDAKDAAYREHIVEIAERVFAEQGFTNTRMQDIAAAAGVSLGTLYQSYPSKLELHRALLTARDREMFEQVLARQKSSGGQSMSIEQLLWLLEVNLYFLLERPDYLRMHLHEGHAWYNRSATGTQDQDEIWNRGLVLMENTLLWGIGEGFFRLGNPTHFGRLIIVLQQTHLANWVVDGMKADHASVVLGIQTDFVRLLCPPPILAALLETDGTTLNESTRRRIRAMDAGARMPVST